jgi:hypothetical protein
VTSTRAAALQYEWRLDGVSLASGENVEIEVPAGTPGCHRVELVVSDRHGGDDAGSDNEVAHFWCFTPQYRAATEATAIQALSRLQEEWVEGQRDFVLGHELFPSDWEKNYLYIDVVERQPDPATAQPAVIVFDQRDYPLRNGQGKVELPFFPQDEDLRFSVRSAIGRRFAIECFVTVKPLHMPSETQWLRGDQPHKLDHFNQPYACELDSSAKFVLNLAGFVDWTPRKIKVGIKVPRGFAHQGEMQGSARLADSVAPLRGWYTELCISPDSFPKELSLEFVGAGTRAYELVWWPVGNDEA